MVVSEYDALIIGGGPGGSTTATFLAKAGKRVLVLEKEHFPRFHVGESLLPYNRQIFAEMGILPKLEQASLIKKVGAQFHLGNGSKSLALVFRNGRYTREPEAFQVERSTFDLLMLNHARECGAEVREGWTVNRFNSDAEGITLTAKGADGKMAELRGKFLIDASGRGNLTGNQEGLREIHPGLKKLAIFGHFSNVGLDSGDRAGDTIIIRLENKWFWVIPISAEKTSVGCVLDQQEFVQAKIAPETIFERAWQNEPAIRERMQNARLLGNMHTTSDFSYKNRKLVGPRLLRVGDAAGFMDPIFSAGVYLACYSGKLAAQVVADSLNANDDGAKRMLAYEKRIQNAMKNYWEMVEGYYKTPFMEIFMSPRNKFNLPSAVTALLAGELEGGWKIRWRMRIFFWLVRVQAMFPLVPRISFGLIEKEAQREEMVELLH
ncbi:MAG: Tryptophan halogenase [Verrucomicrobiales bacterium]|nr:Tryptophan halogenase [Verrucomicrobiales bacterium]